MKTIMLITVIILLGLLHKCEANPISVGSQWKSSLSETIQDSGLLDVLTILVSLAAIIFIESVILLGFLRDYRVLWACPCANVLSTIPGFLLFGSLGFNGVVSILGPTGIIIACFLISILVETGFIVAVLKKLLFGDALISIMVANAVTYMLIVVLLQLGFLDLRI